MHISSMFRGRGESISRLEKKGYVGYDADSGHTYIQYGTSLGFGRKDSGRRFDPFNADKLFRTSIPNEIDSYLRKTTATSFQEGKSCDPLWVNRRAGNSYERSIKPQTKGLPCWGIDICRHRTKAFKEGLVAFIKKGRSKKSFFALDQDTGSGIQTPARADVYFNR